MQEYRAWAINSIKEMKGTTTAIVILFFDLWPQSSKKTKTTQTNKSLDKDQS